ncbi:hypothetical protein [Embleya scabrispora]|nr:hypothetical protein [Embleya scabrispora]
MPTKRAGTVRNLIDRGRPRVFRSVTPRRARIVMVEDVIGGG